MNNLTFININYKIFLSMKQLKFFVMASFAVVLASCGGKKSSDSEGIVLTPETTHIKGDLGDYFEVVDKEYTVSDQWGDLVSVEVKRTGVAYAFDLKGIEPYGTFGQGVTGHAGFGIEILDENGNVIDKSSASASGLSGMYSSDDMKDALKLKEGETCTVRWSFDFGSENKPVKFRLTSSYEVDDSSQEVIETSDEVAETSGFDLNNVILPSQLKGKVEVISAEKSVGSYGYPSMEITFKLLSTVNTSSMCSEYGQMWIVGVGQTENGVDVKELLPNYREWRSGDSDGSEFKQFLEGEPDETITLEFTGDKESSNDVESDLEKVKKFKLKITN